MRVLLVALGLTAAVMSVALPARSHSGADHPGVDAPPITRVMIVPTPSPAHPAKPVPCPSAGTILCFDKADPTLIVMSLAQDPATAAVLNIEISNKIAIEDWPHANVSIMSAPGGWGLADFVNACNQSPLGENGNANGIAGALLVFAASTQANAYNYLLVMRGATRIDADAMFVRCDMNNAPDGTVGGLARPIGSVYHDVVGIGSRNSLTFGPAAAIASAITSFNAANQHQHTLTYTYPSPVPGVTAVPYLSQYQDQKNLTAVNSATLLAASAISTFGTTTQLTLPGNNPPEQLKAAAKHVADALTSRFKADGWRMLACVVQPRDKPFVVCPK